MKYELYHHGVKGQRWGVRRYQNKDGSLTEEGVYRRRAQRASRTKDDVDRIYNKMSDKDKALLGDDTASKEFLTIDEGEYVVKRFLDKEGDTPVAWMDLMTTTKRGELTVAIGTDPDYRGQGRALKLAKKGVEWFDRNADKYGADRLDWGAFAENAASRKIAEKAGFKYEPEKSDDEWTIYGYHKKELKHHGILGQRWGVRRFQNKDGSLTAAGKARRFKLETKKVRESFNNALNPLTKDPINKDEVKRRGKLTDKEADECIRLADVMFGKAAMVEPTISEDVVNAVRTSGSNMYGLEHRIKQPTSLAAKIGSDAKSDNVSFSEAARGVRDTLRYTSVSDSNRFVKSYRETNVILSDYGYEQTRCKNYFSKYKNGEVQHKSIQCTYQDRNGNQFEIQFQTPESQAAKELKIPLYEERRRSGLTEQRKVELENQMHELAERVPYPKGVLDIK